MNKKLIALTALVALGLVACDPNSSSSSPEESSTPPVSTDTGSSSDTGEETNYTGISITNKDEITATWYIEAGETRMLALDFEPDGNSVTLINQGRLSLSSSNPEVATTPAGLGIAAVGVGTATITVTLTNPNGTTVTDSVNVTIENRPILQVGPIVHTDLEEGTYQFGFTIASTGQTHFATGEMSGFYGATVTADSYADATDVLLAKSGDGWTLQVSPESAASTAGQYLAGKRSDDGEHLNFVYQADPFVWSYNEELHFFHATLEDGTNILLGGRGTYTTIGVYSYTTDDEASEMFGLLPYTFTEGYAKVSEPVSGQTYKFGADVEGNPNNAQCITGEMVNTYYLGTTADPEYAIDVTVTEETDGWTLKLENGKYIGVTVSGTHINVVYQDNPYFFDYNTEYGTFIGNEEYDGAATDIIIGLQGTYATMGAYAISEIEDTYVASLYDGYYIADEEVVMTEGPIWTAPADGLTAKFGVYNDSAVNEGYWMITGEMDGFYFGLSKTMEKEAYDAAPDVTAHAVADKENVYTLQLDNGKYIGAAGGDHANILFVDDAYEWTYDAARQIFTTTLTVGEDDPGLYFIGGQKQYDTLSLSKEQYYADNTHAGFFTWGEYENVPEETLPDPVKTTIGDILDGTTADGNTIYQITGILEDLDHSDKYGNAYLTDPTTGESVKVYGISGTMDAFTIEGGTISYENSKDAIEALADVENGMMVTLNVQWSSKFNNVSAVYVSSEADTTTYAIELPETVEHGSITASAETAAYGTEITLTVTPESGYRTDKVTVTTAYGTENLTAEEDGTYKFTATCVNEVAVTFADTSVVATSFEITAEAIGVGSQYGNGSGNVNVNGTEVAISFNQLTTATGDNAGSIQTNDNRDPNSQLWNTVAVPGTITSIAVTFSSYEASDAETTGIGVANEAYSAISATDAATQLTSLSTGTVEGSTVTVEFAEGGSYFTIARIDGGNAAYIASIVVNFTPAA